MNFQRSHLEVLQERLQEKRRFIQVLHGPRQVGKTTLVLQLLERIGLPHFYVSADSAPSPDRTWLLQQWEAARVKASGLDEETPLLLVIDEIQKVAKWSEGIKQLWDEDTRERRDIRVVLTGSSSLLLKEGMKGSLAGRFETIYMGHWSFPEMKEAFGWDEKQFAWFGGYPGAAGLIEDEERWKSYIRDALIETSISKDILMLTRVDKPALMRRLFELGCDHSGQILAFNKILGQLLDAGNTTTLSHYLELLGSAGLLSGIEKFSPKKVRQRASSPKFMTHNTALISAQRPETFQEAVATPDAWGRIVESAVGAHLLNEAITKDLELFYWREGNSEVDFVIQKGDKVTALEVKSNVSHGGASGAKLFHKKFPEARLLMIERGGLSWEEFLSMDIEEVL
jgi:hypothetical protein